MNSNSHPDRATAKSQARRACFHREPFLPDPALKSSYKIGLKEMNREYIPSLYPIVSWIYKFRKTIYQMWPVPCAILFRAKAEFGR